MKALSLVPFFGAYFFFCSRTTVENGAEGGLVLGCFFGLAFAASVGCVWNCLDLS
jgi:hypothetical protein